MQHCSRCDFASNLWNAVSHIEFQITNFKEQIFRHNSRLDLEERHQQFLNYKLALRLVFLVQEILN